MPKTKTPLRFSREDFIAKTEDQKHWNIIVVGGGATGLGVALTPLRVVIQLCC